MKNSLIWALSILIFIMSFLLNKEIGIYCGCLLTVIIGFLIYKDLFWAWLPAVTISWVWVFFMRDFYGGYSISMFTVMDVSIFPIVVWPLLLMLYLYIFNDRIKARNWKIKWLKLSLLCMACLIIIEYWAYNIAGIHLDAGKEYEGWPILNIFHCPWWMQIGYFFNIILFFGIVTFRSSYYMSRSGLSLKM